MALAVLKDAVSTTVVSYTLASGSLTVASAAGFPTPTALAPILVTVVTAATYATNPETFATYQCTGITGAVLTGLTLIDGVDTAWAAGAIVEMRTCAKHINDLEACLATSILTVGTEATLTGSSKLAAGSNITLTPTTGVLTIAGTAGTVTGVSIVTANGLAGTVATATTTPAITLTTSITGILKGAGSAIVAATSGTDYVVPSVATLSSLASIGTITTGTWHGTAIANAFLANSTTTVTAGPGLAGGGAISLGSGATISLALLNPTGVKTGAYNAAANDFVPVDATAGTVVITLPTAPADKTLVGIKLIATSTTNVGTFTCGGTDVFNKAAGSTSLTLNGTMQSIFAQYASATGIWYVIAGDNGSGGYAQGTGITITTAGGVRTIAATGGGSGTVTSVALTVPANMAVSGSPITGAGTLAITASTPNVQVFLVSGTYTVPTGATFVRMVGKAQGGGGGGGGVGATSMFGGSGGGSGNPFDVTYRAADIASSLTVSIGALGTGGAGGAITGANGANAGAAGNTTVTNGATTYVSVTAGGLGHGGSLSSPAGGNPGTQGMFPGNTGGGSSITAAGANAGQTNNGYVPGAGGGGSGITAGGASSGAGGNGGFPGTLTSAVLGGTTGGGAGGAGVAPYAALTNTDLAGGGGGGGGANAAGVGGAGGAGASYGAGGGGGGAAVTGQGAGGAGGNGGPSIVIFYAW